MSTDSQQASQSVTTQQTPISKSKDKLSETSSSSPVNIPTPSISSEPDRLSLDGNPAMDSPHDPAGDQTNSNADGKIGEEQEATTPSPEITIATSKQKPIKTKKPKTVKIKRNKKKESVSSSESSGSDSDSDSEDSSEDEKVKHKKKTKSTKKRPSKDSKSHTKSKSKSKSKPRLKSTSKSSRRRAKNQKSEDTSEDDSSSDTTDSESEQDPRARKHGRTSSRSKKGKRKHKKQVDSSDEESSNSSSSSSGSSGDDSDSDSDKATRSKGKAKHKGRSKKTNKSYSSSDTSSSSDDEVPVPPPTLTIEPLLPSDNLETQLSKTSTFLKSLKLQQAAAQAAISATKLEKPVKKKKSLEFKRVDQVYDMKIRDWKLVESNTDQKDDFDCVFTVRRRLDWDGKYKETQVDIKSKLLRAALQEVFQDCKSISLVEDTPQIDPHTLFHYYDELKTYIRKNLRSKYKKTKKLKAKKQLSQQIAQCKLLLSYIDEDYDATRKALKPMLKAGTITYDLVWALFKPNTIIYTPTYSNKDDPRCFKADSTYEYESWMTGLKSWIVDGRYLEYDGKSFGLGDHQVSIAAFKGHKKITGLGAYPLKYHKDALGIKKQLIERGKKFVALQGMNYRLQKGIAYMKHKNSIVRFIINGRVMVDPAIFRRMNPNYPSSYLRQEEMEQSDQEDEDDDEQCDCESDDEDGEDKEQDKMRIIMWKDHKGKKHPIHVPQSMIDKETNATKSSGGDEESAEHRCHVFTEEELLIASPVVLGFAFSEKLWLEFSLSGIDEIKWNPEAFESLVLPDRIKQNLKGLVSSHRFNAAKTIDDVIQGKGKGLNIVLHGPPGVGKTLTGESIAEYLKCPLYAVSAGELGTNSRTLEQDLNRIMDITHSWGAILLLDEADVFLEARQPHDIHRNSLVSVFLRLTEYYQGILFLTTNRVETFDEAFQSRIHMGIRYENLPAKARKKIWMHHIGKVEQMSRDAEKAENDSAKTELVKPFSDADYDELSKRVMNGRQIKNMVKTSQSIALAEKAHFSMEHVKRVMEVAETFEDDMRGGKGYRDAMRQYT